MISVQIIYGPPEYNEEIMNTIKYLSPTEFRQFKKTLGSLKSFDETEQYGLTITIGSKKSFIIICDDPSLTKEEKEIILQHELAHAKGYDDEEDADHEAYKNISRPARELLLKNWKHRHGHECPLL